MNVYHRRSDHSWLSPGAFKLAWVLKPSDLEPHPWSRIPAEFGLSTQKRTAKIIAKAIYSKCQFDNFPEFDAFLDKGHTFVNRKILPIFAALNF